MPLLDAALAFALTMFAISSLAGLVLEFVYKFLHTRTARLQKMVQQYFFQTTVPTLLRHLEEGGEKRGPEVESELTHELRGLLGRYDAKRGKDGEVHADAKENPDLAAWLRTFDGSDLLTQVQDRKLVRLDTEQMVRWIRDSPFGDKVRQELGENATAFFDELQEPWEELGERFSQSFRSSSKLWATLVGLLLAFSLNIDSLYLLNTYMTDEGARAEVLAEASNEKLLAAIMAGSQARPAPAASIAQTGGNPGDPTGNTPEAAADWDPSAAHAELQSQFQSFQANSFAVGWDLFPNCPPSSADWRCIAYWQRVVGNFDTGRLSFVERQQLNPISSPCRVFFGADACGGSREAKSPAPAAASDVAHVSTEGGPAGGRGLRPVVAPPEYFGRLGPGALFGWILGCCLTAILTGIGSPFWYEIVQRLGLLRQDWYKRRQNEAPSETLLPPELAPVPVPPPTPDTSGQSPADAQAAATSAPTFTPADPAIPPVESGSPPHPDSQPEAGSPPEAQ